ncbi:MAG: immunoglobulin domain-containing protein [Paludibacteraceae bacterium]|nr:immunoglobulin domain-containing protein [Paludibacteraceae bacterium]
MIHIKEFLYKMKSICLLVILLMMGQKSYGFGVDGLYEGTIYACDENNGNVQINLTGYSLSKTYKWYSDKECKNEINTGYSFNYTLKENNASIYVIDVSIPNDIKEIKVAKHYRIDGYIDKKKEFLCKNGDVELTAIPTSKGNANNVSASVIYKWSKDGKEIENVENVSSYKATEGGTYSVVLNHLGCTREIKTVIPSAPELKVSGVEKLCAGGAITLDATGMDSYEWTGSNNFSQSGSQVTITTPGTYKVVGRKNECTDEKNFDIETKDNIDVDIVGPTTLCPGTSETTLTASTGSGSYTYVWTYQAMNGDRTIGAPEILEAKTQSIVVNRLGKYKVDVKLNGQTCKGSNFTTLTEAEEVGEVSVVPMPVVICAGYSATVSAKGTNLTRFDWTGNDGFSDSGEKVKLTEAGVYSVQAYSKQGCPSKIMSFDATMVNNPAIVIEKKYPCIGDDVYIEALCSDTLTFFWEDDYSNDKKKKITESGSYGATVQDNNCTSTAYVKIDFLPYPTIEGDDISICEGSHGILEAIVENANENTYKWYDSKNVLLQTGTKLNVNSAGTYTFVAENDYGCQSKKDFIVTTKPKSKFSIDKDKEYLCGSGEQAKFTVVGLDIKNYDWYNGKKENIWKGATLTVTTAGVYKLEVTGANGCITDTTVSIDTKAKTHIDTVIPKFCLGQTGRIEVKSDKESDYKWTDGTTTNYLDVTASGDYTVTVTDHEFNCSQNVTVKVTPLDTPAILIEPAKYVLCEGSTVTLKGSAGTPPNRATFEWINPASAGSNISVSKAGTYKAIATDEKTGCKSNAFAVVTVTPPPTVTLDKSSNVICEGETIDLKATVESKDTNQISYEWVGPKSLKKTNKDEEIKNATTDNSGKYVLTVKQNNCVVNDSVEVEVKKAPKVKFKSLPTSSICSDFNFTFKDNISLEGDVNDITSAHWEVSPETNVKFSTNKNDINSDILISDPNTYVIKLIYASDCGRDTVVGNLTIDAQLTFSIEAKDSICEGESLQIKSKVETDKQVVYEWKGPNGFSSKDADLTVENTTTKHTGEYSLVLQNGACKTDAQKVNVVVVEKPVLAFDNLPNATNRVCGTFSFKTVKTLN